MSSQLPATAQTPTRVPTGTYTPTAPASPAAPGTSPTQTPGSNWDPRNRPANPNLNPVTPKPVSLKFDCNAPTEVIAGGQNEIDNYCGRAESQLTSAGFKVSPNGVYVASVADTSRLGTLDVSKLKANIVNIISYRDDGVLFGGNNIMGEFTPQKLSSYCSGNRFSVVGVETSTPITNEWGIEQGTQTGAAYYKCNPDQPGENNYAGQNLTEVKNSLGTREKIAATSEQSGVIPVLAGYYETDSNLVTLQDGSKVSSTLLKSLQLKKFLLVISTHQESPEQQNQHPASM